MVGPGPALKYMDQARPAKWHTDRLQVLLSPTPLLPLNSCQRMNHIFPFLLLFVLLTP